jgi:isopropylmalate/homocitrate/citramalate synthase
MQFAGDQAPHRQNPIVGDDIATHRSGIHSDGVIKGGAELYVPQDPRFWGHMASMVIEDGRYQGSRGRAAIAAMTEPSRR